MKNYALKLRRVVGSVAGLFVGSEVCRLCFMPHTISKPWQRVQVDELFGLRRDVVTPCCRWCWRHSSPEVRLTLAGEGYGRWLGLGATCERKDWQQIRDTVLCHDLEPWEEIERVVRSPA